MDGGFQCKDAAGVCDLFAPDLAYSIPEMLQGTKQTMCGNLAKVLARTDIQVSYKNPDVHEIIVSGDVAVVRLTWTLTVNANGITETTTEEGMDIFRRQPDGRWSIARYVAFTHGRTISFVSPNSRSAGRCPTARTATHFKRGRLPNGRKVCVGE